MGTYSLSRPPFPTHYGLFRPPMPNAAARVAGWCNPRGGAQRPPLFNQHQNKPVGSAQFVRKSIETNSRHIALKFLLNLFRGIRTPESLENRKQGNTSSHRGKSFDDWKRAVRINSSSPVSAQFMRHSPSPMVHGEP